MIKKSFKSIAMTALLFAAICFTSMSLSDAKQEGEHEWDHEGAPKAEWLSGDFHQHTTYTDGSKTFPFVMEKNDQFGLDWWANSEHGGSRARDGQDHFWDDPNYFDPNPILDFNGATEKYNGITHQAMWR